MEKSYLLQIIKNIVTKCILLRDKHIKTYNTKINYCCIFAQNTKEYDELEECTRQIGRLLKETITGNLYQIPPIETDCGVLRILKVRIPDKTRPEMGDIDLAIDNYNDFKETYLSKENFKLIERETFEMIELMDKDFNVRIYFSNPPVEKQYELI